MLALTAATRIYLYLRPCDMRKSFDALCGLVRSELGADPLSGSLFVFCNRRRNMVKLLYWDRDGFALWYKRLAKGQFKVPKPANGRVVLSRRELMLLLEGVTPRRQAKRCEI